MNLELNPEEMVLVKGLLSGALEETRVELHHTHNIAFKERLQEREQTLHSLLLRLSTT